MLPRTLRSLNCAIAWGLMRAADGTFLPASTFRSRPSDGDAREVLRAAEKLGRWAGEMDTFEYITILGLDTTP
jgi:hypothetical protein